MQKPNTLRILGIDPGTGHLGWNITDWYFREPDSPKKVRAKNIITGKVLVSRRKKSDKENDQVVDEIPNRVLLLHELEIELTDICRKYQPDFIASENAFIHNRFKSAIVPLAQCLCVIQNVVYRELGKAVHLFAPLSVKACVSGQSQASKEVIQETILKRSDVIIKDSKQQPIQQLNEHIADSIGVTLTFINQVGPSVVNEILAQEKK